LFHESLLGVGLWPKTPQNNAGILAVLATSEAKLRIEAPAPRREA